MSPAAPKVLGRYAIEEEVGRGMMGVVFRARDPVLGRVVALKTVNVRLAAGEHDRSAFEARFLTEARAAALLSHPAIVTVHDFGRDDATDTLYIALEHLEGRTLADIVREDGPLPWRRALAIAGRIAGALDHAHERGIVHRDVKPANIMVLKPPPALEAGSASRPDDVAKLTDFGIARIDAAERTAPGEFLGTPSYMSPEQASGAPMDGRSDVFSLGAVLYFLLTGRRAFDAPTVPGIMTLVVKHPPPPLDVSGLPDDAAYVVARCLAKNPADRYARARALQEDVEDVLAGRAPRHRATWPAAQATAAFAPEDAKAAPVTLAGPAATGDPLVDWVDRLGWRGFVAIAAALLLLLAGVALLKRPAPAPAAAPLAAVGPPEAPPPAYLLVSFRHPFRRAALRVYVDDALVLEETVTGRVTRDLVAVKLRRGTFTGTVEISPGERVVRVEADDGGGFRASRRIRGAFTSGETRRLDAVVDGVVRKQLEVGWGS